MSKKSTQVETTENKYYSLEPIESIKAVYNVIFGVRSYGKTYAMLSKFAEKYWEARKKNELKQAVYVRRYDTALTGAVPKTVCDTLLMNGEGENFIKDLTNGQFDSIIYKERAWYFCKFDENTQTMNRDSNPFLLAVALNTWDKMKGGAYPYVDDIWFEEFIEVSTKPYLKDEFVAFQNVISTIARKRHVTIWLTGNAINPNCPYWEWMGLYNVPIQKPGTIVTYQIGKTDKKIAVEFTANTKNYAKSKTSNAYLFAFEDPKLKMITEGDWEIGQYPLIERPVDTKDICGRFFIKYKNKTYQGDIVASQEDEYVYIHQWQDVLDPLNEYDDLVYSLEYSLKPNYRRRIDRCFTPAEHIIYALFLKEKIFYDNNFTGNAIENFLKDSTK